MNEPYRIPAASIEGVDLKRIEGISETAAAEIMHLGKKLDEGTETSGDLVRLCELLNTYGESGKAEELARCNIVDEDDALYRAYRRLFGDAADQEFEQSIRAFSDQFGVRLTSIKELGFLNRECTSYPEGGRSNLDPEIMRFLLTRCVVDFQYTSRGCIADLYSTAEDFPEQEYLILSFNNGRWIRTMEEH